MIKKAPDVQIKERCLRKHGTLRTIFSRPKIAPSLATKCGIMLVDDESGTTTSGWGYGESEAIENLYHRYKLSLWFECQRVEDSVLD